MRCIHLSFIIVLLVAIPAQAQTLSEQAIAQALLIGYTGAAGQAAATGTVNGPNNTAWRFALWANMVAQAADVATTMYAVGRGASDPTVTFREANPVLRWAQDQPVAFAVTKMGVAAGSVWGLARYRDRRPGKVATILVWTSTAIVSYVAYKNHQLIQETWAP